MHYFNRPINIIYKVNCSFIEDSNKIIFDLLFTPFQNTTFDSDIDSQVFRLSKQDIEDRRQFREGYISTFKKLVASINTEIILAVIINNHASFNGNSVKIKLEDSIGCDLKILDYGGSPYYQSGVDLASVKVDLLRNQAWKEAMEISSKYIESDVKNYRNKNKPVPNEELVKRIKDAPHLNAIIFLQEKIKNSPTLEIQSNDSNALDQ
jgi:hypothetical protein